MTSEPKKPPIDETKDDRAVLPPAHVVRDHLRQPQMGLHVGGHDLGECVVRNLGGRAVVRVDAGAADDDVDAPPGVAGPVDEALEVRLAPDVAGEAEHLQPLVGQFPFARRPTRPASRLETTTRAPCWASARAMARPIPLVEPVTMAVLPVRSKSAEPRCGASGLCEGGGCWHILAGS